MVLKYTGSEKRLRKKNTSCKFRDYPWGWGAGDTVQTEILSGHGKHGTEIHRLRETAPQEKHIM